MVEGSREEQHKRYMLRQNLPGSEVQYYQQSNFLVSILFKDLVLSTVYNHTNKM